MLSLGLLYVIMALCLAPIACLLCCSLLTLAVRAAAKSRWARSHTKHNCVQKHHKINDNTRVGCCSTGMDRHIQ